MKKIISILILILIIGCNPKKEDIKYGTFDLYNNDSLRGTIYRMNNFQIEKYSDNSELIAQIDYETDSTYLINGIEKNQIGIDSIIWLNKYKEVEKNKFKIIVTPYNSDIEYRFDGILIKTNEQIEKKYIDTLNYLNENYKKFNEK